MINSSIYDFFIQFLGIILCAFLLGRILLEDIMPKLTSLRWFLAFSILITIIMFFMLQLSTPQEYAHIYWFSQSISYLLEVAICIQLCKIILVDNWYITVMFVPVMFVSSLAVFIIYSFPKRLSDVVHPAYAYSMISGFMLLIIWLVQDKFEGKLEKPYSVIAYGLTIFMASRMVISYIMMYYNNKHWNIIGRLEPLNEIVMILIWMLSLTIPIEEISNNRS